MVEIMDEDVRDEDFMGHVVVHPAVKLVHDAYEKPYFPPELQWYPVHRGADHGGEVLAAFELLQVCTLFTYCQGNIKNKICTYVKWFFVISRQREKQFTSNSQYLNMIICITNVCNMSKSYSVCIEYE